MIRGQRGPLHRTRRRQRCVQGPSRTISPPGAREALPGPGAARTAARRRDRSSPRALRVGLPHTHVGLVGRSPDTKHSVIRARLQPALHGAGWHLERTTGSLCWRTPATTRKKQTPSPPNGPRGMSALLHGKGCFNTEHRKHTQIESCELVTPWPSSCISAPRCASPRTAGSS